jgi:hypothetical protein
LAVISSRKQRLASMVFDKSVCPISLDNVRAELTTRRCLFTPGQSASA